MSLGLKKKYLMSLVQSGGVSPRLPSAYQEVEYIQSSGTQYFNLNRTLNQTNKIELDFQYLSEGTTSNPDRGALFGDYGGSMFAANPNAKSSYYSNRMLIWRGNDHVILDTGTTSTTPFTNRGTLVIDAPNNQTSWLGFTQTTTSGTGNTTGCWLLAVRDANGTTIYPTLVPAKVYSLKIYTSGVLSNEYIPCYRKADGEIGLYDLVNDVFYTNQGSGTFTCGVPIIYDSRYQQVEWIESSGSGDIGDQYIDTGYTANKNTSVIYKFAYSQITTYGRHILSGPNYFFPLLRSLSNKNLFASVEGAGNVQVSFSYSLNQAYEFEAFITANTIKIDGVSKGTITMSSASTDTGVLYLFGRNDSGSPSAKAKGKLYYCKIYESGAKVREFIPVYRITDNEVGLLDIVNDVFYTNQGSGAFTKGNNI